MDAVEYFVLYRAYSKPTRTAGVGSTKTLTSYQV